MSEFDGLRALVTGGASGIGLAIADRLLSVGARVAVLDLDVERPPHVSAEIAYFRADVSDDDSLRLAVRLATGELGGLDVLVNNAGIGAQGTVATSTDEDWHRVLDVNVVGTARTTRAAWPHLQRSRAAAIVNICSIAATVGLPERAIYSASKGAVLSLTRSIAADGMPFGIRANCINPGTADTPWVGRLLAAAPDPVAERESLAARQPHGRLVTAEEVADAALYLASPASGSTTGTALEVDGGMAGLRLRSGH